MRCKDCTWYVYEKRHCHRDPVVVEKNPDDFCSSFKEVILCRVEVKKEESPKVENVENKWVCDVCGAACKSLLGLHSHKRQHK